MAISLQSFTSDQVIVSEASLLRCDWVAWLFLIKKAQHNKIVNLSDLSTINNWILGMFLKYFLLKLTVIELILKIPLPEV